MKTANQLRDEISKLQSELRVIEKDNEIVESHKFIYINKIKLKDVWLQKDLQWFFTIDQFVVWAKTKPFRPWSEWNGKIYNTAILFNGEMERTPALSEHIK